MLLKVNKIFIVSLFLLAILSLGAASAAENVTADDLAVEDAGDMDLEVPASDEIIEDDDSSNVASDDKEILSVSQEEKLSDSSNVIVINNNNYADYFNQTDGGKLVDSIKPGDTLDIQGSIINSNASETILMEINKPVNIISSTGDGYISLNSSNYRPINTNSFTVTHEGSGSYITGISFYNTRIHIINATNVVLDKLNIVNNQPMGAGATSFKANSTYITFKNSYFYATNNGGSAPFILAWADYCTFDNNTFVGGTSVPNFIYYFVPIGQYGLKPTDSWVNSHNNFTNNEMYGDNGAKITLNIASGNGNLLENNTFVDTSVSLGKTDMPSIVGNNITGGSLSNQGTNSLLYGNDIESLTLGGANALVHNNVINGATTISTATNAQIYENTFIGDYTITFSNKNANNITFAGNDVIGNIVFSNNNAKNNKIVNNKIITSADYAIDLKTYTNTENNISGNILNSAKGFGNDAINHAEDPTLIIEDNSPNTAAEITISVKNIKVGETAVLEITTNETSIASATVFLNGEIYIVNLSNGKGSLEVENLTSRRYDVTVIANDLTYGAQNTTSFTVDKNRPPRIEVDAPAKTQWIESNITVTIKRATGTVTLDINGTKINGQLVDGVVSLIVPDLAHGSYDFNITYSGDYKYEGNTTSGTLTVVKNKQVIIIAEDIIADVVADKFTAKFTNYIGEAIANANVTITIGDAVYPKVTDENGTVSVDLALYRGKYDVNIEFKAIVDEFDATTAKYIITVVDGSIMKILSVDGEGIVTGLLTDVMGNTVANAKVTATMNGIESNLTTDNDGLFKFQAQNGYQVVFSFEGDNTTTLSNASITLNNVAHVLKDSVINVADVKLVAVDTAAGEKGKAYKFTLKDAQGNAIANKNVMVVLDGKVYSVATDANGIASFVISLNAAKTYNMDVFFLGDDDYKGATASTKVTVTKKKTTLKAAKTKYTFKAKAKSKVIKATLKTSNNYLKAGKKVTIKIKGKTYTAKTGKNGALKIKLKSLKKKGTYKAKIKFAGDSTYKASSSKTIKIVIK